MTTDILEEQKQQSSLHTTKEEQEIQNIDFKMVTFTLGDKDYGINIMKIKEISKANHFTYVPNSAAFVRGVYNLRGEIISIVDLRTMFNLPPRKKEKKEMESILIIRMDDHLLGVIVDEIKKVVGISSSTIQPPHPLFGDINIRYINGIAEKENKLYVILDIEKIFGENATEIESNYLLNQEVNEKAVEKKINTPKNNDLQATQFLSEALASLKNFYTSQVNEQWFTERSENWLAQKKVDGEDYQLGTIEAADEFLKPFYSRFSGQFLDLTSLSVLKKILPEKMPATFKIWNPGCSSGKETYSFACFLHNEYKDTIFKIWASDSDLLSISSAPTLTVKSEEVNDYYKDFLEEKSEAGSKIFKKEIRDIILFEFHNILHENPVNGLDLIIIRDLISFLDPKNQKKIIAEAHEKLNQHGILIIGDNESLDKIQGFVHCKIDKLNAYRKVNKKE